MCNGTHYTETKNYCKNLTCCKLFHYSSFPSCNSVEISLQVFPCLKHYPFRKSNFRKKSFLDHFHPVVATSIPSFSASAARRMNSILLRYFLYRFRVIELGCEAGINITRSTNDTVYDRLYTRQLV